MSARTTITILVENTAGREGVLGEHGFSALIERNGLRFLFDTGGGQTLMNNTARLGQSLRQIDWLALSHGHDDHTGGLLSVLMAHGGLTVYAHPEVFAAKYSLRKTQAGEERRLAAGLPWPREDLEAVGACFDLGREPRQVAEGVWLSGEIPRHTPFERVPASLRVRRGEQLLQDEMLDEQSLFLKGAEGVIVILGCAHPGIVNTIEHARQVTGSERVQAVLGGTHLAPAGIEQITTTVAALRRLAPALIGTAHCTGWKANARIAIEFPEAYRQCSAGTVLELA